MHKDQLKNRLKFVPATPLPDRAVVKVFSRKQANGIEMVDEETYSEQFDSFFDFEEDLSGMRPAGEQFIEAENSQPFVEMESSDHSDKKSNEKADSMTEEVLDRSNEPIIMLEPDSFVEMQDSEKKTFEFKACKHIKDNGEQCKRQAPKNGEHCSSHRKFYI